MLKMKSSVLAVCLFGFSMSATASTLEECAKLLPDGHTYKVEIILDVDKTEKDPTVKGSFGVTGGAMRQILSISVILSSALVL